MNKRQQLLLIKEAKDLLAPKVISPGPMTTTQAMWANIEKYRTDKQYNWKDSDEPTYS